MRNTFALALWVLAPPALAQAPSSAELTSTACVATTETATGRRLCVVVECDAPAPTTADPEGRAASGADRLDAAEKGTRTKNRLPDGRNGDLGPPDGFLEKRNPQTGELQQRRHYDEKGKPRLDIDFHEDHGAGIPHAHDWTYPSPRAQNPVRGEGRPLSPKEREKLPKGGG